MLWYIMTFTSLALPISFPSLLIILFPSWLMCGCLFNPHKSSSWAPSSLTLKFIPLRSFVALPVASRFLVSLLVLSLSPFSFTKGFKRGCSTCKHPPKIKGCSGGFWYPLSMFHLKAFLSASVFPFLLDFWSQLVLFHLNGVF